MDWAWSPRRKTVLKYSVNTDHTIQHIFDEEPRPIIIFAMNPWGTRIALGPIAPGFSSFVILIESGPRSIFGPTSVFPNSIRF